MGKGVSLFLAFWLYLFCYVIIASKRSKLLLPLVLEHVRSKDLNFFLDLFQKLIRKKR